MAGVERRPKIVSVRQPDGSYVLQQELVSAKDLDPVSVRQYRILEVFNSCRVVGIDPTRREVMALAEISSTSVVDYNVRRLFEKGYLRKAPVFVRDPESNELRLEVNDSWEEGEEDKNGRGSARNLRIAVDINTVKKPI